MRLLVDTHLLLLWLSDDKRLPRSARALIADGKNDVFVSAASLWEIAIKSALGRLELRYERLDAAMHANRLIELPITGRHAARTASLPYHHHDPFDRMLVAQSLVEPLNLLTHDKTLAQYSSTVMLV